MNKTFFTVTALVATFSLAFIVPTSYAESKPETKASCQHHHCKQCACDKKSHQTCQVKKEKHNIKK